MKKGLLTVMLSSLLLVGSTFAMPSITASARPNIEVNSQGVVDKALMGTTWNNIDGKFIQIAVGDFGVWGVNANNKAWFRGDLSASTPTGKEWTKVDGNINQIAVGDYGVWGVNSDKEIYVRDNIQ